MEPTATKPSLPHDDRATGDTDAAAPTRFEDLVDLDFEDYCAREGDDSVTLEEVLRATAKIPGSMAETIAEEERADRF
jgi:hypothetical protein